MDSQDGHNEIQIELADGTKIIASDNDLYNGKAGVRIEKDSRSAILEFNAIGLKEDKLGHLININNLSIENVDYKGDEELIKLLKDAVQKQFMLQREKEQKENGDIDNNKIESNSSKGLIGNDLFGAINDIMLGRVSIEDIGAIYATDKDIGICLKEWEILANDERLSNERDYTVLMCARVEEKLGISWDENKYKIYQDQVNGIVLKLLQEGKVVDIDREKLPKLPKINIPNNDYEAKGWADDEIEFCIMALRETNKIEDVKEYFPEYAMAIDKMYPLLNDIEEYVDLYYNDLYGKEDVSLQLKELEEKLNNECKGFGEFFSQCEYYSTNFNAQDLATEMFKSFLYDNQHTKKEAKVFAGEPRPEKIIKIIINAYDPNNIVHDPNNKLHDPNNIVHDPNNDEVYDPNDIVHTQNEGSGSKIDPGDIGD